MEEPHSTDRIEGLKSSLPLSKHAHIPRVTKYSHENYQLTTFHRSYLRNAEVSLDEAELKHYLADVIEVRGDSLLVQFEGDIWSPLELPREKVRILASLHTHTKASDASLPLEGIGSASSYNGNAVDRVEGGRGGGCEDNVGGFGGGRSKTLVEGGGRVACPSGLCEDYDRGFEGGKAAPLVGGERATPYSSRCKNDVEGLGGGKDKALARGGETACYSPPGPCGDDVKTEVIASGRPTPSPQDRDPAIPPPPPTLSIHLPPLSEIREASSQLILRENTALYSSENFGASLWEVQQEVRREEEEEQLPSSKEMIACLPRVYLEDEKVISSSQPVCISRTQAFEELDNPLEKPKDLPPSSSSLLGGYLNEYEAHLHTPHTSLAPVKYHFSLTEGSTHTPPASVIPHANDTEGMGNKAAWRSALKGESAVYASYITSGGREGSFEEFDDTIVADASHLCKDSVSVCEDNDEASAGWENAVEGIEGEEAAKVVLLRGDSQRRNSAHTASPLAGEGGLLSVLCRKIEGVEEGKLVGEPEAATEEPPATPLKGGMAGCSSRGLLGGHEQGVKGGEKVVAIGIWGDKGFQRDTRLQHCGETGLGGAHLQFSGGAHIQSSESPVLSPGLAEATTSFETVAFHRHHPTSLGNPQRYEDLRSVKFSLFLPEEGQITKETATMPQTRLLPSFMKYSADSSSIFCSTTPSLSSSAVSSSSLSSHFCSTPASSIKEQFFHQSCLAPPGEIFEGSLADKDAVLPHFKEESLSQYSFVGPETPSPDLLSHASPHETPSSYMHEKPMGLLPLLPDQLKATSNHPVGTRQTDTSYSSSAVVLADKSRNLPSHFQAPTTGGRFLLDSYPFEGSVWAQSPELHGQSAHQSSLKEATARGALPRVYKTRSLSFSSPFLKAKSSTARPEDFFLEPYPWTGREVRGNQSNPPPTQLHPTNASSSHPPNPPPQSNPLCPATPHSQNPPPPPPSPPLTKGSGHHSKAAATSSDELLRGGNGEELLEDLSKAQSLSEPSSLSFLLDASTVSALPSETADQHTHHSIETTVASASAAPAPPPAPPHVSSKQKWVLSYAEGDVIEFFKASTQLEPAHWRRGVVEADAVEGGSIYLVRESILEENIVRGMMEELSFKRSEGLQCRIGREASPSTLLSSGKLPEDRGFKGVGGMGGDPGTATEGKGRLIVGKQIFVERNNLRKPHNIRGGEGGLNDGVCDSYVVMDLVIVPNELHDWFLSEGINICAYEVFSKSMVLSIGSVVRTRKSEDFEDPSSFSMLEEVREAQHQLPNRLEIILIGSEDSVCCGKSILESFVKKAGPFNLLSEKRCRRLRLLEERRSRCEGLVKAQFVIEEALLGLIIGKQGAKLSQVAKAFKVEIRVLPSHKGKRVIRIYGPNQESVESARDELEPVEKQVQIHRGSVVRILLGRKGSNLKEICSKAGVRTGWYEAATGSIVLCGVRRSVGLAVDMLKSMSSLPAPQNLQLQLARDLPSSSTPQQQYLPSSTLLQGWQLQQAQQLPSFTKHPQQSPSSHPSSHKQRVQQPPSYFPQRMHQPPSIVSRPQRQHQHPPTVAHLGMQQPPSMPSQRVQQPRFHSPYPQQQSPTHSPYPQQQLPTHSPYPQQKTPTHSPYPQHQPPQHSPHPQHQPPQHSPHPQQPPPRARYPSPAFTSPQLMISSGAFQSSRRKAYSFSSSQATPPHGSPPPSKSFLPPPPPYSTSFSPHQNDQPPPFQYLRRGSTEPTNISAPSHPPPLAETSYNRVDKGELSTVQERANLQPLQPHNMRRRQFFKANPPGMCESLPAQGNSSSEEVRTAHFKANPPGVHESSSKEGRSPLSGSLEVSLLTEVGTSSHPPSLRRSIFTEEGRYSLPPSMEISHLTERGRSSFPPSLEGEMNVMSSLHVSPTSFGELQSSAQYTHQPYEGFSSPFTALPRAQVVEYDTARGLVMDRGVRGAAYTIAHHLQPGEIASRTFRDSEPLISMPPHELAGLDGSTAGATHTRQLSSGFGESSFLAGSNGGMTHTHQHMASLGESGLSVGSQNATHTPHLPKAPPHTLQSRRHTHTPHLPEDPCQPFEAGKITALRHEALFSGISSSMHALNDPTHHSQLVGDLTEGSGDSCSLSSAPRLEDGLSAFRLRNRPHTTVYPIRNRRDQADQRLVIPPSQHGNSPVARVGGKLPNKLYASTFSPLYNVAEEASPPPYQQVENASSLRSPLAMMQDDSSKIPHPPDSSISLTGGSSEALQLHPYGSSRNPAGSSVVSPPYGWTRSSIHTTSSSPSSFDSRAKSSSSVSLGFASCEGVCSVGAASISRFGVQLPLVGGCGRGDDENNPTSPNYYGDSCGAHPRHGGGSGRGGDENNPATPHYYETGGSLPPPSMMRAPAKTGGTIAGEHTQYSAYRADAPFLQHSHKGSSLGRGDFSPITFPPFFPPPTTQRGPNKPLGPSGDAKKQFRGVRHQHFTRGGSSVTRGGHPPLSLHGDNLSRHYYPSVLPHNTSSAAPPPNYGDSHNPFNTSRSKSGLSKSIPNPPSFHSRVDTVKPPPPRYLAIGGSISNGFSTSHTFPQGKGLQLDH